jgi:hypothetical protein
VTEFVLRPDPELLRTAVVDARWTALAKARTDLGSLVTWDPAVPRTPRVLVPVDVAAFVVADGAGEPVVPVGGTPRDPAPFAAGSERPAGVHLHWAMPDALLRGRSAPDGSLALPLLPDRWVVVRTVLPAGGRRALVHGWVVDAPTGHVTALAQFDGTHADGQPDVETIAPLDAGRGGGPLWTATLAGAQRRFAWHDPLTDLAALGEVAPAGLHGGHACYTVAGWWTQPSDDPLMAARGPVALARVLAGLGWFVDHDATADADPQPSPQSRRLSEQLGFTTAEPEPPVTLVTQGRVERYSHVPLAGVDLPVSRVREVMVGAGMPRYASLLHGAVVGVPVDGSLPAADDRPPADALGVALGADVDDLVAAFGAAGLGLTPQARAATEQLLAAFASGALDRYGTDDGLVELGEREHSASFWSFPGAALPTSTPDRLRVQDATAANPSRIGRKGRAGTARQRSSAGGLTFEGLDVAVRWRADSVLGLRALADTVPAPSSPTVAEATRRPDPGESRTVPKPAPRLVRPLAPLVGLRGVKPSHRHHDDGRYDPRGLQCRFVGQCVRALRGVVDGAAVVPTLGSGAIPDEVLPVVRETVLLDPYATQWLAAAGREPTAPVRTRVTAEMVRLYGTDGAYDPSGRTALAGPMVETTGGVARWAVAGRVPATELQMAGEVARFSLVEGTPPSPIGLTSWRQPWVPLWLEWEVEVEGTTTLEGWRLDQIDLAPDGDDPEPTLRRTLQGRSPISEGAGALLEAAIGAFLDGEQRREVTAASLGATDAALLRSLGSYLHQLDLVSASLDGLREQLLGLDYVGQLLRAVAPDGVARPVASGLPVPLLGGRLRVLRARLVDAFGRVLDVPVDAPVTTSSGQVPDEPGALRLRPRLQHGARWLFRLVDPGYPTSADPVLAPEAFVDQVQPELAVNPVVGFLLPDHVDEALEVFDAAGAPLGQLLHDPITGGVLWETAPGRPLPPDSGPLDALDARTALVGRLAAGVVQADVEGRAQGSSASALSEMLRAIDTTLWTVDTYAATGSASVAGLVGRPIAVVRATLRLDLPDDVDDVLVSHAGGPQARAAAFAALAAQQFPVRLGDLARSDDALLGFVVDDDYRHLHLVDRAVAAQALPGGRHQGYLGLLGASDPLGSVPVPLAHDYLVGQDTLWVRPGQTVRLTLLMLPAGRVHLTSGVLPRKHLALADDWVTPGLVRLVPSLRIGPVLVDPGEIRLPLAHHLGPDQTFTRRTGPLTWRDDPIVAASQAALLPRLPHEAAEGWVRVTPADPS